MIVGLFVMWNELCITRERVRVVMANNSSKEYSVQTMGSIQYGVFAFANGSG